MNVDVGLVLFVLCDVVAQVTWTHAGHSQRPKGITTQKNVNFVEAIKEDLKRNNDDYKERKLDLDAGTRPAPVATSVPTLLQNKRIKIKSNRRNNDQYYEMYDLLSQTPIKNNKSSSNIVTKSQRLRKLSPGLNSFPIINNQSDVQKINGIMTSNQQPFVNFIQSMKQKHRQMTSPKQTDKNKIMKFRQFVAKNKDLIKQYMNTKPEVSVPNALRQLPPRDHRQNKPKNILNTLDNINDGKLPNPEVLDMAPARGGRVFKYRLKGRLCHRHVLMPEGPKYDSAGQWYVPAHGAARSGGPGPAGGLAAERGPGGARGKGRPRDYANTRPPLLLLPRCCNCCKKSVLGCQ